MLSTSLYCYAHTLPASPSVELWTVLCYLSYAHSDVDWNLLPSLVPNWSWPQEVVMRGLEDRSESANILLKVFLLPDAGGKRCTGNKWVSNCSPSPLVYMQFFFPTTGSAGKQHCQSHHGTFTVDPQRLALH